MLFLKLPLFVVMLPIYNKKRHTQLVLQAYTSAEFLFIAAFYIIMPYGYHRPVVPT